MSKKKYNDIPVVKDVVSEKVEEVVEKKSLEKVVTSQPKKVKKSLVGRLVSGVVGPEGASGIGEYINNEIILPAIKNIVVDAVTSGINKLMYGEQGGPNRYGRSYGGSNYNRGSDTQRTNYSTRYTSQSRPDTKPARERGRHSIEEYIIADRYEASHVLTSLTEAADSYGSVSVADYYDLIDVASVYTDNQYGWTFESISRATIISVRGGFVIRFPQLEVI